MEFDGGSRLERDGGRSERGGGGGRSERDSGGGSGSDELVVESERESGGGCNELVVESDGDSGSDESGFGGSGVDEGDRVCCGGGLGFLGGGGPIEFVIAARRIEEKLQRQWCVPFFAI